MFGSVVNFGTSELLWLSSNNFFCEVAILEAIFVSKKIYKVATMDGSQFWNLENDNLSEVVGVIPTRSIWMGIRAPLQLGFPSKQELLNNFVLPGTFEVLHSLKLT